jgi:translation initiation factor 2B subunit (eIF-2B alpha/beta/delta family)
VKDDSAGTPLYGNLDMIPDEKTNLLDGLQNLLEKQIKLVHQGNSANRHVEFLSEQAGAFVEKIAQAGILELPEFENRREHLQKLYQQLCLAIAAQKADIAEKLRQVRKCRKTIATYRRNI